MLKTGVCVLAVACGAASAGLIGPSVVFAVNDSNNDNIGDSFPSASLNNSIITRFGNRRAMAEFPLATLGGPVVSSATVTGTLDENFSYSFGTTPADFEVVVYAGNGVADLGDFEISGTVVGVVSMLPDDFDSFVFSFDAAAALQAAVDAGATHAGVRVRAVQANVGEVDLLDTMLDVVAVPAPGSAALLCLGGLAMRRRRG